jgi:hypothetical protein
MLWYNYSVFDSLCSWVCASWIKISNCPTRCDYMQFYYFSASSSTCFGWYPHPSSGAHVNCNYNIWHRLNRIGFLPVSWMIRNPSPTPPRQRKVANTVRSVLDVVITVYVCWWVRVSLETCRAVCRNIIKLDKVASCWASTDKEYFVLPFLSAFEKLWKATVSFVISVRQHAITRLPLDGFSWNFIKETNILLWSYLTQ